MEDALDVTNRESCFKGSFKVFGEIFEGTDNIEKVVLTVGLEPTTSAMS
jgi:hypothetical protein